jgi:hypothetical protein
MRLESTKAVMEPMYSLVSKAVFHIAPERATELSENVFSTGEWALKESTVNGSWFCAIPQEKTLHISPAGLASIWSLSFVAMRLSAAAVRARRQTHPSGALSFSLNDDEFGQFLAFSTSLFKSDRSWPELLPRPKGDEPLSSEIGRATNLFLGATSWVVLHEIAHVHHGHEKLIPASERVRDEFQADRFATDWVLEEARNGIQREFRVLTISVAMLWIFLNEMTLGRDTEHPAAILRFREVAQHFHLKGRSVALEQIFYILTPILLPEFAAPGFDTPKEAFDWLYERLGEKFAV